jgi:hypothetical protein
MSLSTNFLTTTYRLIEGGVVVPRFWGRGRGASVKIEIKRRMTVRSFMQQTTDGVVIFFNHKVEEDIKD